MRELDMTQPDARRPRIARWLLRQMCTDAQRHRTPRSWDCPDCRGPRATEMCADHRADLKRAEAYVLLRIALLGPAEAERIMAEFPPEPDEQPDTASLATEGDI